MKSWTFSLIFMVFAAVVSVSTTAFALNNLTYQGRIVRPDGSPLESSHVTITVQIKSPGSESCLLFQETHLLDMTNSEGIFSISIGGGTRASNTVDGGFSLARVFSNSPSALSSLPSCDVGSSYTPNSADSRKLIISFNDGSGVQTLQEQNMAAVPFSIESHQISGYPIEQLLRVDGANATALTPAQYTKLTNLVDGTSNQYTKANQLGSSPLPSLSAGDSLRWNGSTWETYSAATVLSSLTAGTGLTANGVAGATISSAGTLALSNTGATAGTYGDASNIPQLTVDAQGRITSVSNVALNSVTNFSGSLAGDVSGTQGATSVDKIKGVAVSGTPATGQVLRHNGTQWIPATPNVADLKNSSGVAQFPTTCDSTQTLTFDSVNDKFVCTAITVTSFGGSLAGDVSGPQNATVVTAVGGVTAANVGAGATLANSATNANTASTIVRRDASGNFYAGTITANVVGNVTGTATNTTQIQAQPVDATAPTGAGQTLRWDGAKYVAGNLKFQDLKTSAALAQFPTTCSTTQVMIYSAVSDAYECQNITLSNTTSILGGDVTGSITTNTVSKIQNRDIASTAPNSGEVLKWNGSQWAPAADNNTGSITQITAGTGTTGGGTSGNVTIAVAYGSTAGTAVQGNDARVGMGTCAAGNKNRWNGTAWVCEAENAEADTLATVTGRGASTSTAVTFGSSVTVGGALVMGTNTVVDANGGWHRSYGDTGWYNGTWAGGWYMSDASWVRSYGNKGVYTSGEMQAGVIRGNSYVCIGSDCRSAWPSTSGTACGGYANQQVWSTGTFVTYSCGSSQTMYQCHNGSADAVMSWMAGSCY